MLREAKLSHFLASIFADGPHAVNKDTLSPGFSVGLVLGLAASFAFTLFVLVPLPRSTYNAQLTILLLETTL